MCKHLLSWLVFVAHTVLFSTVWMGCVAPDAGQLGDNEVSPPAIERVITSKDHSPHNASSMHLGESDQIEESLEQHSDAEPPPAPTSPSVMGSWTSPFLPLHHLADNRGRAPPRPAHARVLPTPSRWLAVSLPSRGPPA